MAVKQVQKTDKKSEWTWKKKTAVTLGILVVLYIGISIYFTSHFYPGTTINGYNSQLKTVDEVKAYMKEYADNYSLTLKERMDREETIAASDMELVFSDDGKLEKIKEEQKGFAWISFLWREDTYQKAVSFEYDEEALRDKFESLDCFNKKMVIEPKSAYSKYNKKTKKYEIINEVEGNTVKKEKLYDKVKQVIYNDETVLDVEKESCYRNPSYYRDHEKVIAANDLLNKYVAAKITYDMDYTKEVVDAADIHKWLTVDKNYKVSIDKSKIREFMAWMGKKYNTVGIGRKFKTPGGSKITVYGGTYGWRLNQVDETEKLYKLVKKGAVKEKEPLYLQKGLPRDKKGRDLGDTYVAISISGQYMWYYKNGECLISTPVVTGNPNKGRSTPKGTYAIAFKKRNHTMKGDDYSSFVNYWLPFYEYRGIGIHDASWRSSYGGSIYLSNGSHGCVNTPYGAVQYIYENIEPGIPVIVY